MFNLAVILRERKDATTVVEWVTLTREGRDAERMGRLRTQVREHDVDRWARSFLETLDAQRASGAG